MADPRAVDSESPPPPGWRMQTAGEDATLLGKPNGKTHVEANTTSETTRLAVSKHDEDEWRYPTPSPGDILNASGNARKPPPLTPPSAMDINGDLDHAKLHSPEEGKLLGKINAMEFDDRMATPPADRYNTVYLIMLCHGIAALLSWNMIITASNITQYFVNYKLNTEISKDADYRKEFMAHAAIASQVPQFVFCVLNVILNFGGGLTRRIVASLSIMVASYATLIILAIVDSQTWPYEFFVITITLVINVNMCNGVYQNSIFGVAGMLPGKYSNAIVLGNNISGTLVALIDIISTAATSSAGGATSSELRKQGIYYFVAVLIVLLVAFQSYFILPFLKYFTFFQRAQNQANAVAAGESVRRKQPLIALVSFSELWLVFKQIKMQCFNVFFVFFVTLSLFPAVQAAVVSPDRLLGGYFTSVTCFLSFNLFAMCGNLLPAIVTWPGPRHVIYPIVLRAVFFIFFALSNAPFGVGDCLSYRNPAVPVAIYNDVVYIMGTIIFAFTSGYYSSLIMMYAPRLVAPKYAPRAGQIAAFFLVLGVTSGVLFGKAVKSMLTVSDCQMWDNSVSGSVMSTTIFSTTA